MNKRTISEIMRDVIAMLLLIIIIFLIVVNINILIENKKNPDKIPSILGYIPMIVVSGSMEPIINEGDLVIAKRTLDEVFEKNDIVIFLKPGTIIATVQRIGDIQEINRTWVLYNKGKQCGSRRVL